MRDTALVEAEVSGALELCPSPVGLIGARSSRVADQVSQHLLFSILERGVVSLVVRILSIVDETP